MARALRLRVSNTIGLIVPDISNPFFSHIAKSIEKQSFQAGYTLIVCSTNEVQEREDQFISDLLSRGLDGLIIAPVQDSREKICELLERKFPFVLIDRKFDDLATNAVISDNEKKAYETVAHLAQLGHQKIGFISGRQNIYTIQKRLSGFKRAMMDYNLAICTSYISGDGFTFDCGYAATKRLLEHSDPPTALLITGNIITFGAIKAIIEKGLIIPKDISLIGFTDNLLAPFLICPLTTVTHPLDEMGKKAFQLLLKSINTKGSYPFKTITVESTFNIRESTSNQKESISLIN